MMPAVMAKALHPDLLHTYRTCNLAYITASNQSHMGSYSRHIIIVIDKHNLLLWLITERERQRERQRQRERDRETERERQREKLTVRGRGLCVVQ